MILLSQVHAGCGAWGVIAGSLFARSHLIAAAYDPSLNYEDGLFYGQGTRLGLHIIAVIIVFLWSASSKTLVTLWELMIMISDFVNFWFYVVIWSQ